MVEVCYDQSSNEYRENIQNLQRLSRWYEPIPVLDSTGRKIYLYNVQLDNRTLHKKLH